MKMLDGYMVKPYCQKYINFVEVDVHVAGVLKEHAYKVEVWCTRGWAKKLYNITFYEFL